MDLKGRSWPAKLWNKKPDGPAYIHGWQAFRDANDLRPGDSFIFELIEKEKKPVLKMCSKFYLAAFFFLMQDKVIKSHIFLVSCCPFFLGRRT